MLIKLKTLKTTKTSKVDLCLAISTENPHRPSRVIRKSYAIRAIAERERSIITEHLAGVSAIPKILYFSDRRPERLTYEFIVGLPLYQTYAHRHTSIHDVLKRARSALLTLSNIHYKYLIHNDLSPGNLILSKQNHLSIIDFGNATLHDCSEFLAVGKPHYASPEQLDQKPTDARSDIYQLGCVLFEMIYKTQYLDANSHPHKSIDSFSNTAINRLLKLMLESTRSRRITSADECINIIDNVIYNHLV